MSPRKPEPKIVKGGTMHIVLKSYLERLETSERSKPAGQRRRVPTMDELAKEAGLHYVTLNKIVNNNISQLSLETGGKIISAVRRFGFPMAATDLIDYLPEETE
jgi:hypothetical protein